MKLDPRTKLFLAVVANGMIFSAPLVYSLLMVVVASVLLLLEGKWKFVCTFFFVYLSAGFFFGQVKNLDIGTSGTIILASLFLMYRIMPACAVLYYVITTTKVNEFLACMSRMHVSNKVTIPLRLFSLRTLKSPVAFLEYRLVPLLVSVTKIGDELSIAAVTRGLSAETKRTCIATIGFRWVDFVVIAYCVAVVLFYVIPGLTGNLPSV